MQAYLYNAALYCGPCMVKALLADGKASPAAADMEPTDVLFQVVNAAGYSDESDYDSGNLPKGPYADGGGEADSPQHCDTCNCFLENPLTGDGVVALRHTVAEDITAGRGDSVAVTTWAPFYGVPRALDAFTRAYVEAALWSSMDNTREDGGDPLDQGRDYTDVAADTLARMMLDCEEFQRDNAIDLAEWPLEQAGHDFWLTRNHHGAGFWDRGYSDQPTRDRLTAAAHGYGDCELYIGDDGKIYS